jgi:Luciferase-like monooxygenase
MYGIPGLDHRVGLFSEGLQVIRSLWTEERTNFAGRYYTMRNAVANPKPIQKPYPPIWVGSGGPRMLKLTARHADVWNASGGAVDTAVAASRQLDEACAAIDREPNEIRRSVQLASGDDPAEIVDRVRRYHESGFTEIILMLSGGSMSTSADPVRTAAMLAEKVLPELRADSPS